MQTFVHYFLHLVFPLFIAWALFRDKWKEAYFIMLATMLIDLDHLLASPVFAPNRCSIGFHYLHTLPAGLFYFALLFVRAPYRIIGIGLLFHLFTDFIDCLIMYHECNSCYVDAPAYEILRWVAGG